jgi:transcriptional regulator with GAF, ATPase, and Fis domain
MPYLRCHDPVRQSTSNVALKKPLMTIGRAAGNDVVLDDAAIAGTHANLLKKGEGLTITVVDRGNEIYVNGKKTKSADLKDGDHVLVGRFELTVMAGRPEDEAATDGDGKASIDSMQQLVAFSIELMHETTHERLFKKLLESVVTITRAEKGFVIVLQDGQRHLAASHNVGAETLDLSRVSDSIIDKVIEDRRPIIVSDALADRKFGRARSVVDLKLSSVLCIPLLYRNDLLGVLYLGNDSITGLFTEADLSLAQIWATQASLIVHTALMLNELKITNRNLREQLRASSQGEMIGSSAEMKACFKLIRRIAPTDLSVLVLGETGTGKELVAKELHRLSDRAAKPFVSINCGAIPEHLLESELFGHKKGSFTGAVSDKVGKFESANGGTLFLDEIGEMPMNLQVKLLRVLQDRIIERVGDLEPRPVDIRVVSATNKVPEEEIKGGKFREDLYYRLNDVTVALPPLRARGDDIHQLAKFFLAKYAEQYESKARGFTNEAVAAMLHFYWPGNVRELESRVKKAVIMSDRALLNADDLQIAGGDKRSVKRLADAEEEFKVRYIKEVLELNNWNKAETARDLDVDPRTIFRYIEKFED